MFGPDNKFKEKRDFLRHTRKKFKLIPFYRTVFLSYILNERSSANHNYPHHLVTYHNFCFSLFCAGGKPHYYQMILGEDMKVVLRVSVVNLKESAYETKLFIKLPEMVDFGRNEVILCQRILKISVLYYV